MFSATIKTQVAHVQARTWKPPNMPTAAAKKAGPAKATASRSAAFLDGVDEQLEGGFAPRYSLAAMSAVTLATKAESSLSGQDVAAVRFTTTQSALVAHFG